MNDILLLAATETTADSDIEVLKRATTRILRDRGAAEAYAQ